MKKYFGSLSFYRQALMIGVTKRTDFARIVTARLWLKKEKWLKNLTVRAA